MGKRKIQLGNNVPKKLFKKDSIAKQAWPSDDSDDTEDIEVGSVDGVEDAMVEEGFLSVLQELVAVLKTLNDTLNTKSMTPTTTPNKSSTKMDIAGPL